MLRQRTFARSGRPARDASSEAPRAARLPNARRQPRKRFAITQSREHAAGRNVTPRVDEGQRPAARARASVVLQKSVVPLQAQRSALAITARP